MIEEFVRTPSVKSEEFIRSCTVINLMFSWEFEGSASMSTRSLEGNSSGVYWRGLQELGQ
jgi:hypothetical protein